MQKGTIDVVEAVSKHHQPRDVSGAAAFKGPLIDKLKKSEILAGTRPPSKSTTSHSSASATTTITE